MTRAKTAFAARGERFTKLREAVLRTLAESHEALGAYDIIERLRARGRVVAPISVYRILDTLLDAGLVHRIESRNAFVACHGVHDRGGPVLFLVCEACGTVAESPDRNLADSLQANAGAAGFRPREAVLEMNGLCRHCGG
jgi:Fur family zinc uptake transcriptional regulator